MRFITSLEEAYEFLTPAEAGRPGVITDPRRPDNPIVFVTPAFEEKTGYPREELLGRNCRLLQGPDTDPDEIAGIRKALHDMKPVSAALINYRKDGTPFPHAFSIRPSFGPAGDLKAFVSVDWQAPASDPMPPRRWQAALRSLPTRLGAVGISPRP